MRLEDSHCLARRRKERNKNNSFEVFLPMCTFLLRSFACNIHTLLIINNIIKKLSKRSRIRQTILKIRRIYSTIALIKTKKNKISIHTFINIYTIICDLSNLPPRNALS